MPSPFPTQPELALVSGGTGYGVEGSPDETIVLGIETSCDETAASVVARNPRTGDGRVLSNIVRSQWEDHRPFGGVVPEIAARAHVECLDDIIRDALREAGISLERLDAVAATAGPGLVGGLIVGLAMAKALALAGGKPLVAVNHLEAHALTVGLTEGLAPPYLLLLVSGGHTQILAVDGLGEYRRLGTTIDDALGEAFDKTAKLLGLGFPGGPAVERMAQTGNGKRFALPRPMFGRPEPHFSFAGLKTAVRQQATVLAPLKAADVADLCASFESAVADCVVDRLSRAMAIDETARAHTTTRRSLVVAGGVAANARLRSTLAALCAARGYTFHAPPIPLCSDNAAMVAWVGALRHAAGAFDALDTPARARWPLDQTAAPVIGTGRLGAKA